MSDSLLDHPAVVSVTFHPREEAPWEAVGADGRGGVEVLFGVGAEISLGGRLFWAGENKPLILMFHGNGEIAADYAGLGPFYTEMGLSFLVADYRGYGVSGGTPTGSDLLHDAVTVWDQLPHLLGRLGLTPGKIFVMGRSLGSAAALEAADQGRIPPAGLIIESGFAHTFPLLERLGLMVQSEARESMGFRNVDKAARVSMPTLVIHGEEDEIIPVSDGRDLHQASGADKKRLEVIPGAGHNDLMASEEGRTRYFGAIREWVGGGE